MTLAEAGQGGTWRIGPSQLDTGNSAYIDIASPTGLKALRPLAPTYVVMKKDPAGLAHHLDSLHARGWRQLGID